MQVVGLPHGIFSQEVKTSPKHESDCWFFFSILVQSSDPNHPKCIRFPALHRFWIQVSRGTSDYIARPPAPKPLSWCIPAWVPPCFVKKVPYSPIVRWRRMFVIYYYSYSPYCVDEDFAIPQGWMSCDLIPVVGTTSFSMVVLCTRRGPPSRT